MWFPGGGGVSRSMLMVANDYHLLQMLANGKQWLTVVANDTHWLP